MRNLKSISTTYIILIYRPRQILSVLPASTTDCERGFSTLAHIKTNDRTNLEGDHLESSIRISLTDIDEIQMESHSQELIQRWRNHKQRRSV